MDFPMDFWLFWIRFISDSFWFVQIFTLLNVAPPPPCTCTLCCDMMLVTDIPYNMVNCGHGPYSAPESRKKRRTKKILIGFKIYGITMYIVLLEECTSQIKKNFYLRCSVLFCKIFWTLPGRYQPKVSTLSPPTPLPKKSIGARPYGFKNLYPSKKPATLTQQLQKSIDAELSFMTSTSGRAGGYQDCIDCIAWVNTQQNLKWFYKFLKHLLI